MTPSKIGVKFTYNTSKSLMYVKFKNVKRQINEYASVVIEKIRLSFSRILTILNYKVAKMTATAAIYLLMNPC